MGSSDSLGLNVLRTTLVLAATRNDGSVVAILQLSATTDHARSSNIASIPPAANSANDKSASISGSIASLSPTISSLTVSAPT